MKDPGENKYDWGYNDIRTTIVADGADHPDKFGGTWSIKQEAPDEWVWTRKRNGQVTSVSTWTLTDGGQQLNIEEKGTRADGSNYTGSQTVARIGPGAGFVGRWELKSAKASSFPDVVINPNGEDGLSFTTHANKQHLDIKFDGKEYPDQGPGIPPSSTAAAKRSVG